MILTKASKLALYAVTEMAIRRGELVSASAIATRFGVSENHVAKVLQQLTRAELVRAVRGAGGGYELERAPADITMAEVVRSIEGPIGADGCEDCPFRREDEPCSDEATCGVHGVLSEIADNLQYTLASVTIATLARHKTTRGGAGP